MNLQCRTNHNHYYRLHKAAVKCCRRMTFVVVAIISMILLTSITSSFNISPSFNSRQRKLRQQLPNLCNHNIHHHRSLHVHVTQRSEFDFSIPPIKMKELDKNEPTTIKTLIPTKAVTVHFNSDIRTDPESTTSSTSTKENLDWNIYLIPLGMVTIFGIVNAILSHVDFTMDDVVNAVQQVLQDPQTVLNHCVETVQGMGPLGIVYFGIVYVIAEVLAIPAVPLSVSAGYLFGLPIGVSIVLLSATIAASISFVIGKTVLRSFVVTKILQQNPKLAKIDRIIGERGFNLLIVLRLSPLFPFALSNYVYGASSIDFVSYFWATLLGFAPGTIAYVYTGMVGKEIMFNTDGLNDQPWYVYGLGFTVILGIMKVISDTASGILQSIDDDDDEGSINPVTF
jgi:uncharacterized membrane protein YdjX (TVP38/TMEM64 family)